MATLKYKLTNDILFKMMFVQYPDLLKRLVAALLGIRVEDITQFDISNPEMPPLGKDDKYCRLDIKMIVNGRHVDLEIQVEDERNYPERSLYNWAREYSSALSKGKDYSELPQTVVVSIVAFPLFGCEEFHSEFRALEVRRHEQLTDRMSLHYFELPKLPEAVRADDELILWLSLFGAKTEEELERIEKMEVPVMKEAIGAYRHVSATKEFQELERIRFEATCNEASALNHARWEGKVEVAKNLKAGGRMSVDEIALATGLTVDDILRL